MAIKQYGDRPKSSALPEIGTTGLKKDTVVTGQKVQQRR